MGGGGMPSWAGKNHNLETLLEKLFDSVLLMNNKLEGLSNRVNTLEERVVQEIMLERKQEGTEFMNEVKSKLAKLKKSQEEEQTVFTGQVDDASDSEGCNDLDVPQQNHWNRYLNSWGKNLNVNCELSNVTKDLKCKLSKILERPYPRKKSGLEKKLKNLNDFCGHLEIVLVRQEKKTYELECSYNKALFELLDQVPHVNNMQILETLFSDLKQSTVGFLLESETRDEDSAAVANEISSELAADEHIKYMKAKLQLAKEKLFKEQMKDVSATAEISEPLVDNAVDDHGLVKNLQGKLQKLRSVEKDIEKCVYDRLKVLKLNEKAEYALRFFQRRLEDFGCPGNRFNSRSCKRKRGSERPAGDEIEKLQKRKVRASPMACTRR